MIQEHELEEGETCSYNDDESTDPLIKLSYLGDKLQRVLGHLQKDFEGGVSAENLGAKFGGYGSFLPMHQRSPQRVQNPNLPRSPNVCPKGPVPNSVMPSTQRDSSSSPMMRASRTLKTSSDDASVRQKVASSSSKVGEAFPEKVEHPSRKSSNPLNHRTLKVRIKVGPETAAQYNAQIHSLGLTSPSSSEGNFHDESDGLLVESHETPNESPANILKIMASALVPGGLLLSPLCEDLLNLARQREYSVKGEYEAAPKNSAISVKLLKNDVSAGNKRKIVDKSRNFGKSEDNFIEDLKNSEQKTLGGDNMECSVQPFRDLNCRPLHDTVEDSDKDVVVKKRRVSEDRMKGEAVFGDVVKDASLRHTPNQNCGKYEQTELRCRSVEKIGEHRAKTYQKDVSVDPGQDSKGRGKGNLSSFKACSDSSEGEGIKKAMDNSILKVGLNPTSSEHNGFYPHDVGMSSLEGGKKSKGSQSSGKKATKANSLRNGGGSSPKNKSSGRKDVHGLNLSQKDVVHTNSEHVENPKRLLVRPSVEKPKNFNFDDVKAKSVHAGKLKERSSNKKCFDRVPSDTHLVEPPAAVIQSTEGIFSGLEHTVAAPVLIQEDWVACDRCERWRLLPYGTKSDQLPDKWVCSMLNWLPGMNRCDVSQDDTTNAVQASYLVPVPENQHNFQAHGDGTMAGVISASEHDLNQDHQNPIPDQMKKQKFKEKQNKLSMSSALPSNGKKQMQRLAMNNGNSMEVKLSLKGVNATNQSNPNKSATVLAKFNKRKNEHVREDDPNLRKKIKKDSGEQLCGKGEMKRIKSKDALTGDNFQTSGGNVGMIGHNVASGVPRMAAVKNGKESSAQKDGISGRPGNAQCYVKKHKDMQYLPDNGPLDMKTCNSRDVTTKKIKLKDFASSQHQVETWQNIDSELQGQRVSIGEDRKDGYFHADKKSRVSQIEEESRRSQGGDISKRKIAEARVRSSGNKEYPMNRGMEKEQQVSKPRAKLPVTGEDIDKLKDDLGGELLSMAATSSSSKVSDCRKNRLGYTEVKGSPEESVSSSPMRMLHLNQASPMMMETAGKVDSRFNDAPAIGCVKKFHKMNERSELGTARKGASGLTIDSDSKILDSKNNLKEEADVDDNHDARKHEISSNMRRPLSYDSCLKSVKNGTSVGKNTHRKSSDSRSEKQSAWREHDKNDVQSSYPNQDLPRGSVEQVPGQWSGKVRIDLRQGDKQGASHPSKHSSRSVVSSQRSLMDSRPHNASVVGDASKALKGTAVVNLQDGTDNFINNEAGLSLALDTSVGNKNVTDVTASTASKEAEGVLKEAEQLRTHADLIKNSGFSSESNYEYFKAALNFLRGASLLEACNGEPTKHLEMSPMQMYGAAAQLCKTCANEYEKSHELAAAALAYKCMEVAYLRVVYCKSSTTCRVWQDLQLSLQMVPQGESPSSSASDVDNLNNLAIADKATLSKGSGSHAGSHVIITRNCPNFVQLLDFTKDVNSAMEAAKKSQDTFAAVNVEPQQSLNKEAIISVKRVIDFSFQDIEELVRLARLAFNTINHQGLRGSKE